MQSSPCAATNLVDALRTSGRAVQINSRLQLDFTPKSDVRPPAVESAFSGRFYSEAGANAACRPLCSCNLDAHGPIFDASIKADFAGTDAVLSFRRPAAFAPA